jgi:hypothetical protein
VAELDDPTVERQHRAVVVRVAVVIGEPAITLWKRRTAACASTDHSTPSVQPGVVSEPSSE